MKKRIWVVIIIVITAILLAAWLALRIYIAHEG